jgi:L-2-hydroxyglutarate oxidase LhgO
MEQVDVLIVGAGVIGLAIARELAMQGREVVVLEREQQFGTETSSRSSEVIHAGLYYTPGGLKARLCVEGRHLLYRYCAERQVAHRRCGKLIVATAESQKPALERVEARAQAAGVFELQWLDGAQARRLEPALRCELALLSPETGIIDSHGLMLALLGEAQDHGAMLAVASRFESARALAGGGFEVRVAAGASEAVGAGSTEPMTLRCRTLINAAGLHASKVARAIEGIDASSIPETQFAKGNYFVVTGGCPFTRLIYPTPNEVGLGVHLTLDLAGQARFGPDVEWVPLINYDVDPGRCQSFYDTVRAYWPGLPDGALVPGYAGIRPNLVGPGAPSGDFRLEGPAVHGVSGLLNLLGMESPGLTACLAIAREACARLEE